MTTPEWSTPFDDTFIDPDTLTTDQKFAFMLLDRINKLEDYVIKLEDENKKLHHDVQVAKERLGICDKPMCDDAIQLLNQLRQYNTLQEQKTLEIMRNNLKNRVPDHILNKLPYNICTNIQSIYSSIDMGISSIMSPITWITFALQQGIHDPEIVDWLREIATPYMNQQNTVSEH